MRHLANPFARDLIDPFNPSAAFDPGIAMPAAYGISEAAVRKVGLPAAYGAAKKIAQRTGKPVLCPCPGTKKALVARPKKRRMPWAYVPKRRPTILPAQVRGPLPDKYVKLGQRGGMLPAALWKTARLADARATRAAAVDRQEEAEAARRSSNQVPGRRILSTGKAAPWMRDIGPDHRRRWAAKRLAVSLRRRAVGQPKNVQTEMARSALVAMVGVAARRGQRVSAAQQKALYKVLLQIATKGA